MRITIDEGPDRGVSAEITGDIFTIGRDPGSRLVLKDPQVSTRHATIETAPDGSVALRDLQSTNGTFFNGQRVHGAIPITGTERVRIGQDWVQFSQTPDRTVIAQSPLGASPTRESPRAAPPPAAQPAGVGGAAQPAAVAFPGFAPPGAPPTGRRGPRRGLLAAIIGVAVLLVGGVVAAIALTGGSSKLTPEQLIAGATPSVVRIIGNQGAGSGVVIDAPRQLVLTNAHVVVGNSALKAQVGNTTGTVPVRLVAASPCNDLAVVKLADPVANLKALPIGSSSSVHPGDQVTVLGFPGSFQTTMGSQQTGLQQASTVVSNTGTVSQVGVQGAPDPSLPTYQDLITHQAPTNHGDSGGPLLDQRGRVVGINTLANPATQGQYYSIAIDYAKRLLPDLEAGRSHGLMGWNLIPLSASDPNLNSQLQSLYGGDSQFASQATQLASDTTKFLAANPPTSGMYDSNDQPGTAADKAGTAGFLIDKINGNPVTRLQDVCDIVNSASPGQVLRIHNYNIDSGNSPANLSSELAIAGKPYSFTTDVTVPKG